MTQILVGLGVEPESLGPSVRLRAGLALTSVETTELGLELERQFGAVVDLWDARDYTLGELADAVGGGGPS